MITCGRRLISGKFLIQRLTLLLLAYLALAGVDNTYAKNTPVTPLSCSLAAAGNAVINEILNTGTDNPGPFIEIKLLQGGIIIDKWQLCSGKSGACYALTDGRWFANGTSNAVSDGDTFNANTWLTHDLAAKDLTGSSGEFVLQDALGNVIDYVAFDTGNSKASCGSTSHSGYAWNVPVSCGSCINDHDASNKDLGRFPDGTGEWSDNGNDPSLGASNDDQTLLAIDHFLIEHDGTGLTCEAEAVTIKACANSDCSSIVTDSVTLELKGNAATISSITFTGTTDINFNHAAAEVLTLSIANSTMTVTNPLECSSGAGSSCDIVFADAGFRFIYGGSNVTVIPSQTAGSVFTDNLKLQAVQNVSGVCSGIFTGDVNVELAQQSIAPEAETSLEFTVNGHNIGKNSAAAVSNYQTIQLNFSSNSVATITSAIYQDAGKIQLHANYDIGGMTLSGSSNSFWVSPDQLIVTAKSGGLALNTTTVSGAPLHKAGRAFDLVVSAVNVAGTATPNYIPGQIQLLLERTSPVAGGSDGELTYAAGSRISSALSPSYQDISLSDFSAGVSSFAAANYSEVGLLKLALQDSNYGGANIRVPATAINIGRFVPDSFALVSAAISVACSSFSYMEQTFNLSLMLSALNSTGVVTKNYQGDHAKSTLSLVAENANDGIALTDRLAIAPSAAWVDGEYSELALLAQLNRKSLPSPTSYDLLTATNIGLLLNDGEADVAIALQDLNMNVLTAIDCIGAGDCDAKQLNDTALSFYYGRTALKNTFGPDNVGLAMPLEMEYFNGSRFILNRADSCSSYLTTDVTLANPLPLSLSSSASSITGMNNGLGSMLLTAPNEVGSLDVELEVPAWLRFDWDGDGNHDNNPKATATFGRYRGNDRIIYWREVK